MEVLTQEIGWVNNSIRVKLERSFEKVQQLKNQTGTPQVWNFS